MPTKPLLKPIIEDLRERWEESPPNRVFGEMIHRAQQERGLSAGLLQVHMGRNDVYPLTTYAQSPRRDGWPGRTVITWPDLQSSYLATGDPALIDLLLDQIGCEPCVPKPGMSDRLNGRIDDELSDMTVNIGEMFRAANEVKSAKAIIGIRERVREIRRCLSDIEGELNDSESRLGGEG
ncbi:phage regulatory CII family protein [bacterium]|nr:phage regulatory CII family protein [bacterium]